MESIRDIIKEYDEEIYGDVTTLLSLIWTASHANILTVVAVFFITLRLVISPFLLIVDLIITLFRKNS
jgi:hypothetical protein